MNLLRLLKGLAVAMVGVAPRRAALLVILMVTTSLIEGVNLLVLLPLLGLVGVDRPDTGPGVTELFDRAFQLIGIAPTLGSVLLLYVGIAALRAVLLRSQAMITVSLQEEFTSRNRVRIYRAIAGSKWQFLVTRRPSEFVHVLAGEIERVGSAASQVIGLVISLSVTLVYLVVAVMLSPVLATVLLSCAVMMVWFTRGRMRLARELGIRGSRARNRLHGAIAEHVGSMKTAKSYGAIERHAEFFTALSHDMRDIRLETTAQETSFQRVFEFGSTVLLAVIVYTSFTILGITAAELLVLLFIFARLTPRIVAAYRQVQQLAGVVPVVEIVNKFEQECLDAAEPPESPAQLAALASSIRLENVSFTYLTRPGDPALRNLNFEIEAGLTTAIVGSSGAGKSTLTDLLIGLLSPTVGRITIDSHELRPGNLAAWRRRISYVPQDTFLFHASVRENLAWARPGAVDNDLWHALRLAAADEFVSRLPNGLDTIIGERGILVSGGERQRLSLARALLRQPSVLVLDEATSSLDSETERRIQMAIEGLHREMTIIIVTHRLSMISGADRIHVLDHGCVVESGTWEELLSNRHGRFASLCRAQGIYHRPERPLLPSLSLHEVGDVV